MTPSPTVAGSAIGPAPELLRDLLRRLESVTGAIIRWPWLGRRALARRSALRGRNILSGCLMRTAVAMGLIGYRELRLDVPR